MWKNNLNLTATILLLNSILFTPAYARIKTEDLNRSPSMDTPQDYSEESEPKVRQKKNKFPNTKDQYNLKIGLARPTFSKDLLHFKEFYRNSNYILDFSLDWSFFNSSYLTLGFGGQLSNFSANGKQKRLTEDGTLVDASGHVDLTLVPYKLLVTGLIKPFAQGSLISFNFWGGYEELYFQEVRSASSGISTKSLALVADSTEESSQSIFNSGWNSSLVLGFAMNFLLNDLDEKTSLSLKKTMNLEAVYFSPFYEVITKLDGRVYIAGKKSSKANYSTRQSIGIAFTFSTSS